MSRISFSCLIAQATISSKMLDTSTRNGWISSSFPDERYIHHGFSKILFIRLRMVPFMSRLLTVYHERVLDLAKWFFEFIIILYLLFICIIFMVLNIFIISILKVFLCEFHYLCDFWRCFCWPNFLFGMRYNFFFTDIVIFGWILDILFTILLMFEFCSLPLKHVDTCLFSMQLGNIIRFKPCF